MCFCSNQWLGVINRSWTGDEDLAEYNKKHSVNHANAVDKSNRLFHQHGINKLPTLLIIKDGKVLHAIKNFDNKKLVEQQLN